MGYIAATASGNPHFSQKMGAFFEQDDGGLRVLFRGGNCPEETSRPTAGHDDAGLVQISSRAQETA